MPEPTTTSTIESAEYERLHRTEGLTLVLAFGACAAIFVLGIFVESTWAMLATGIGAGLLGVAWWLWKAGRLHEAAFAISAVALGIIAATAATGLGFHDLAITAYPVVLIFAGMSLRPRGFALFFAFAAALLLFAGLAAHYDWVPQRVDPSSAIVGIYMTMTIFVVTGAAVALLSSGVRQTLELAHEEIERRTAAEERLVELNRTDCLTSAHSRRFFHDELDRLRASRRYPVSVLVIDLDDLKLINDSRGHSDGDRMLIDAAALLGSVIRPEDILARIGGDEFAVLLPETDESTARTVRDRICTALDAHNAQRPEPHLQLSIGVATADLGELDAAIERADHAMYAAKLRKKSVA